MLSRRQFGTLAALGFTEAAFAQRALAGPAPSGTIWLDANENPDGPPPAAIQAMARVAPTAGRYHFLEFDSIYAAIAGNEKLRAEQVLVGAGSTEGLQAAVHAFTSPQRPFITAWPTFEAGPEFTAAVGNPVVKIPLNAAYVSDVKKLAAEADRARGGFIYICNPNNPTAAITPKQDIQWLVDNLPRNTVLMVDEAYIHFAKSPDIESALKYVNAGKDVVVLRTFSKIYGMAGLRVGFAAARPDLIQKMAPFRNAVISIVSARAVAAAIDLGPSFIDERREKVGRIAAGMTTWCRAKKLNYIEPHANFMMIDVKRDVGEVATAMLAKGIAVGRRFPPYDTMLRVTLGQESEMEKCRKALGEVLSV